MINIPTEIRRWVILGCVIAALCLAFAVLTMCKQRDAYKAREQTAAATTGALDKVANETPAIRADQEEKQRDVDAIEGSSDRLPDGFGRDLECVRRGSECRNPR